MVELEPSVQYWSLRVTEKYVLYQDLEWYVKHYAPTVHWMVRELGDDEVDNPHYHIGMMVTVSEQSLRKALKKILKGDGNEAYSFSKVKDIDAYYRYCMKGTRTWDDDEQRYGPNVGPVVKLNTRNDAMEAYKRYWEINAQIKDKQDKKDERKVVTRIDKLISEGVVTKGMTLKAVYIKLYEYALLNSDVYMLSQMRHLSRIVFIRLTDNDKDEIYNMAARAYERDFGF